MIPQSFIRHSALLVSVAVLPFMTTPAIAAGAKGGDKPASAVDLAIGGEIAWWFTSAENGSDYAQATGVNFNNLDVQGEGWIYFDGKAVAANGLEAGFFVSLEAGARDENDPIDLSYGYLTTALGKIELGSNYNVATIMGVEAPRVGWFPFTDNYVFEMIEKPSAVSYLDTVHLRSDYQSEKINIYTPEALGLFQLGVSWVPGDGKDLEGEDETLRQINFEEGYVVAARFGGKFNRVRSYLTGGYASYNVGGGANRNEWNAGLSFGVGPMTVSGAYRSVESPLTGASPASTLSPTTDGTVWNAGVELKLGRRSEVAVSAGYQVSEVRGTDDTVVGFEDNDKVTLIMGGASWEPLSGVTLFMNGSYATYEDETAADANNNEGFAISTGMALRF